MAAIVSESREFIFCDKSIDLLLSKAENPLESMDSFFLHIDSIYQWKLEADPSFARSIQIKEIRRTHKDELGAYFSIVENRKELYEPFRKEIESLQLRLNGKQKEIESRQKSKPKRKKLVDNAVITDESNQLLQEAHDQSILLAMEQLKEMELELTDKMSKCEPYQLLKAAIEEYEELKLKLGITQLKKEIVTENKIIGERCSVQGNKLETIMSSELRSCLLSSMAEKYSISDVTNVALLTSVGGKNSIGFAAAEFDGWIVEWNQEDKAVRYVSRVLGIVEAKNNPNDIGTSFVHFQESLAFLTNSLDTDELVSINKETAVPFILTSPPFIFFRKQKKFKTKQFPKGIFRLPSKRILHVEKTDGYTYEVAGTAFEHFNRHRVDIDQAGSLWTHSKFNHTQLFVDNM